MSIEFLLTIGVILILILVGIIFFVPSEKRGTKKTKKPQEDIVQQKRDLEQKISRLDRYIRSLRDDILALQKSAKSSEKELMVERVKVKKFQEKLSQERTWYKKEHSTIDKKGEEFRQLKGELEKVQESFSKEHSLNIRLEREVKDLKQRNDSLNDQRREAEGESARLKAKDENSRKEIAQLKKDVAQLSKKEKDVQWVAKSEYDRVSRLLKEREKEFQRLERELEK